MSLAEQPSRRFLLLRVFAPFAFGYFLSYIYRTINAVLGPVLMQDLALTPPELGFLTGTFFLAFAATQLPLGLAMDRFGPRRTEACLLLIAALGALVFALAEQFWGLSVGRALIGIGVSGCLLCAFKAFAMWFRKERLALLNGSILSIGALGAVAASSPLQMSLAVVGWREVFFGLAFATVMSALLIMVTVPERTVAGTPTSWKQQTAGLLSVLRSRHFWQVAPLITAAHAAWLSHQALWLGPWLRDVSALDASGAAEALLMGAVGMACGFFIFGATAERLGLLGVPTDVVAGTGTVLFVVVQFLMAFEVSIEPRLVCFAFGFFGGAITLFYAGLTQRFPVSLTGRVTTTAALLAFTGGFVLSVVTGLVVQAWPGPAGYMFAFAGAAMLQVLGFAWLAWHWMIRTRARQIDST